MELRRKELLAKPPRRTARPSPRPHADRPPALAQLQRAAGNAAVASLVQPLVQREPDTKGWTGAKGWNEKAQEVGSTKIERIPIEGLKAGNQEDFGGGGEHDKTKESAKGRAVVLLPLAHDPKQPTEVMLHYHGFGHRSGDPYAGWRQDTGSQTVRDVEQDRIEEQMKAAIDSHADAAQTIVVLVQGVGASKFGGAASNDYAKEALRIAAGKGFTQLPEAPKDFKLVLSAHSGGGQNAVLAAVQVDPKKHTITEPDNLAEIVLMDAIHGWHADLVGQWAEEHMRRVREAADPKDELARCPTLRLYHSDDNPYPDTYGVVEKYLKDSHAKNPAGLKAALLAKFPLPVHLSGGHHETAVRGLGDDPSAGPLADAIGAIHHPDDPSKVKTSGGSTWKGLPASAKAAQHPAAVAPTVQRQPTDAKAEKPKKAKSWMPAGAIPSSRLGELGTPEETKFRRDVYDAQFRRTQADATKVFTVGLTPKEIGGGKVEGKPIHKDVAADAQALVDAARAALAAAKADDKAPDHKLAKKCTAIGIQSAYRSIEDDFSAWQSTYENALKRTKKDREALGEGELYSNEALNLMVKDLLGSKASPGFSNHSKGLAMDFSTTQGGDDLGPHVSQREAWRTTWLHQWLVANAAAHHFNPLSTEEWHWDHDAVAPAPTGDAEAHGDAPAPAAGKTEAPKPAAPAPAPVQRAPGDPPPLEITYGAHAHPEVLAANSLVVLGDVLRAAGLHKAEITSTARTAEDQARAMYQNLVGTGKGQGVAAQHELYAAPGDAVIDVFVDLKAKGKNATEIKAGMQAKIEEIGPSKVSNHCADPAKLNVFDVGPASLGGDTSQKAFVKAAQDEEGKRISRFIPYPKDPGDHFEIVPS